MNTLTHSAFHSPAFDSPAFDSPAFESAVSFVLAAEGGYVNHPNDPGGATNFGISQRQYPDLAIETLTQEQAEHIYYQDYWQPCRCGELPSAIGTLVFDTAVNMGSYDAISLLQVSLDVRVDGILGPVTLTACFTRSVEQTLAELLSHRAKRYAQLGNSQRYAPFVRGWMKRLFDLQQHLYEERLL